MRQSRHIIDTSNEMLIQRWGNGVKLIKPSKETKNSRSGNSPWANYQVSELFALPSNVYFLNTCSQYLNANTTTIESNGFTSLPSAIGKTVKSVSRKESALQMIQNDKEVIRKNKFNIIEEFFLRKDNIDFHTVSVKFPFYSMSNKIIGLFGISLFIGNNPKLTFLENLTSNFSKSLLFLAKAGFLIETSLPLSILPGTVFGNVYLSKRETDILHYVIRGKTAKEIGKALNLSHRTVETYFANVKCKLNVSTKSELIEKIFYSYSQNL